MGEATTGPTNAAVYGAIGAAINKAQRGEDAGHAYIDCHAVVAPALAERNDLRRRLGEATARIEAALEIIDYEYSGGFVGPRVRAALTAAVPSDTNKETPDEDQSVLDR